MSPQLEDGYTRIADTILEKVAKTKLNGTQFRILMIVWRSTYGWQKKEHELSLSYLVKATELNKRQLQRELNKMIEEGILIEKQPPGFNTSRVIEFNKNFSQQVLEKTTGDKLDTGDVLDTSTGSELDTSTGSELDTQNKELNKHIKKQIDDFFEECWKAYPNKQGKGKISDTKKKEVYKLGDEFKRCMERYFKHLKKETWKKPQNGSTFWNSGYVDFLDSEYEQETKPKHKITFTEREGA